MAKQQSHVSLSVFIGVVYALVGILFFDIYIEGAMLAFVFVLIAGVLPDVDAIDGPPARELAGLVAAFVPIVLLKRFPFISEGGIVREVFFIIVSFLFVRGTLARILANHTRRRGMIHSIPAAIIVSELAYLLFDGVYRVDRLYLSFAVFVGFIAHLLLDAGSDLDIVGKAVGSEQKKVPVLKVSAPTTGATLSMYGAILFLGWFVANDFKEPLARLIRVLQ